LPEKRRSELQWWPTWISWGNLRCIF